MKLPPGLSLVEIILGVALLALIVSATIGASVFSEQSQFISSQKLKAINASEEGVEAARNLRDENFTLLATGYNGLSTTSSRWNFSGNEDTLDDTFRRHTRITQIDNFRMEVTASTTWDITSSRQGAAKIVTRLTNWRRRASGAGQGAAPVLAGSFDLTTANSGSNVHDAISIAFKHPYVFLGRVSNPGREFYVFDVSTPSSPSLIGQIDLNGDPNDMVVSGNYVYIASNDNSQELQIVDVSTPTAPFLAASFNLTAGNSGHATVDALTIAGSGNYIYLVRAQSGGKEFIVFDVSSPTSPSLVGSLDLSGDAQESAVSGSYVYLASTNDSQELQIVDVSLPSLPTLIGTLNLDSGDASADGASVTVDGSTVFFGRKGSQNAPEFYVIDSTTPILPALITTLDVGTLTLQSIANSTTTSLVYVAARAASQNDYFAIDVSTPSSPALLTTLNLTDVPYKIVYGFVLDKAFIASGADNEELQVISP
jgi:hypothetical protein